MQARDLKRARLPALLDLYSAVELPFGATEENLIKPLSQTFPSGDKYEEIAMCCLVASPGDVVCPKPVRRYLEDQHGGGQAVAKALRVFGEQWDVQLRKLRPQNQQRKEIGRASCRERV